jgi:hypothetical protein
MTTTPSPKYAKTLSGTVYSYAAETVKEFLQQLSTEKDIPLHLLCLLDSEGELSDDTVLSEDEIYSLFVKEGVKYRKWVVLSKIDRSGLNSNPFSEYIFRYGLDRGVGADYPRTTLAREMIDMTYIDSLAYDDYVRWLEPEAVHLVEKIKEDVNWDMLSQNRHAISIIEKNLDKVWLIGLCNNRSVSSMGKDALEWFLKQVEEHPNCWGNLSSNPSAIPILEQNLDKIDWKHLSSNPSAIPILEKNLDKIDWKHLSSNPSAIPILEQNLDKIDWEKLSYNRNAIPILEQNLDKIDWQVLSSQTFAIHLLEQNPDKIDWKAISINPEALHLIEQNLDKIDWKALSRNPVIFERYELR